MFPLFFLVGMLAGGPDAAATWEVRTLAGETVVGTLVRIEQAGLTLATAAGERTWPLEEIHTAASQGATAPSARPPGWLAELADGSRFACSAINGSELALRLSRGDGATLDVPRTGLRQLRRHPPTAGSQAIWTRLSETPRAADVLVVRQRDEFDFLEGVIDAITPEGLTFVLDGEAIPVKWTKIEGCQLFATATPEAPRAPVVVRDVFESELRLDRVGLADGRIAGSGPALASLVLPLGSVREILPAGARLQSLVGLTPEIEDWTPYFGADPLAEQRAWYGPRRVAAGADSPLVLAGVRHREGLVLHSRTRLVYRLSKEATRFQALVGLSDQVRPEGHVRLRITLDGQPAFDEAIDGRSPPRPVDLPLEGAARLEIVVDFGAGLDVADELVLAEPRILE